MRGRVVLGSSAIPAVLLLCSQTPRWGASRWGAWGKEGTVRRVTILLTVMGAALLLACGAALAVTKVGTNGDDVLRGTDEPDLLDGRGGDDTVYGEGGNDSFAEGAFLVGGLGQDVVYGGTGDDDVLGGEFDRAEGFTNADKSRDVLYGGDGNDSMNGFAGEDVLYGEDGRDFLVDALTTGEQSEDRLFGGPGRDRLDVDNRPAAKDIVFCGDGVDRVDADGRDVLFGCERRGEIGPT